MISQKLLEISSALWRKTKLVVGKERDINDMQTFRDSVLSGLVF